MGKVLALMSSEIAIKMYQGRDSPEFLLLFLSEETRTAEAVRIIKNNPGIRVNILASSFLESQRLCNALNRELEKCHMSFHQDSPAMAFKLTP